MFLACLRRRSSGHAGARRRREPAAEGAHRPGGRLWYPHSDVRGFRFSTEASLVRLIQEATEQISFTKARTRATKILGDQFRDGALKVRRAWEDTKVPDTSDEAWLVILDWDEFGDSRGVDPNGTIPVKVASLWEDSNRWGA